MTPLKGNTNPSENTERLAKKKEKSGNIHSRGTGCVIMKTGVACGQYPSRARLVVSNPDIHRCLVFLFLLLSFVQFFVLLHGYGLSLALLAEFLHNSDDSAVAKALEN